MTTLNKLSMFTLFTIFVLLSTATSFQFNENGEYTILQFTDLHFCESGAERDANTQKLQSKILNWIKPDLIVVSGDAVSGWMAETPGAFETCWRQFTEPITEAQIPYAYIFGNHDAEGVLDRFQIAKLDETHPFSVRRDVDGLPGKLNFEIPLYSSKNKTQLAANIWLFDTGSRSCDGFDASSWGCVEQDTIDWYTDKSRQIKKKYGDNVHHLAFLHIPIPEFINLANTQRIYGNQNEEISCPIVNNGFFKTVLKNQDISAMFFGHDHANNFGGLYQGIELAYGQKSGYGSYGQDRGARVITLKEEYNSEGKLSVTRNHYVMFENGTVGLTQPTRPREGEKLKSCVYLDDGYIWKNIKIFYWKIKKWLRSFD